MTRHENELLLNSSGNFRLDCFGQTAAHAGNMGLPQAGRQCIIEVLCFLFTFVLADRLVLLSPA